MLGTPSSGIVRQHADRPDICTECGKPTPNCGTWNKPDYRCRNYACARCPFKPEKVDTSISRLGH